MNSNIRIFYFANQVFCKRKTKKEFVFFYYSNSKLEIASSISFVFKGELSFKLIDSQF